MKKYTESSKKRKRNTSPGRPVELPLRAALLTMEDLKLEAAKRREKREEAAKQKQRCAHDAFNSPPPQRRASTERSATARENMLKAVLDGLADKKHFISVFTALRSAVQHKVTKEEADKVTQGGRSIRRRVAALQSTDLAAPAQTLAERLQGQWAA